MTDHIVTAAERLEEYQYHRADCSFTSAPMDVCDCTERNLLDALDAMQRRIASYQDEITNLLDDRDEALARAAAAAMEMRERAARVASMFGQGSQGIKTSRAIGRL